MITTHVLDTSLGRPAQKVPVTLEIRSQNGQWKRLGSGRTDSDGRITNLLGAKLRKGTYRLRFDTAAYQRSLSKSPGFFPEVTVVFTVRETTRHYHVPVLLSPYGYSTYRGS